MKWIARENRPRWRSIAEFLALKRNTALLLVALVLAGTGEKLWLGFAPKYLQTLGASIFIIGLFDALQTLLGALYAYPGGWLTDRWGQRRSLMLFSALSLAGYTLVLVWHHWLALLLGAFLFLAWSALSLPTTFTVVATSLKARQHTMGIGVQSMVRRVPMMLGPLGGRLADHALWLDPGRALRLVALPLAEPADHAVPMVHVRAGQGGVGSGGGVGATTFFAVTRSFTPALRELLVSDILIRFCERIPYAFVILWAMNQAGMDAQQFGVLVAFEMVTAMICYIPVAHLADKYGRRPHRARIGGRQRGRERGRRCRRRRAESRIERDRPLRAGYGSSATARQSASFCGMRRRGPRDDRGALADRPARSSRAAPAGLLEGASPLGRRLAPRPGVQGAAAAHRGRAASSVLRVRPLRAAPRTRSGRRRARARGRLAQRTARARAIVSRLQRPPAPSYVLLPGRRYDPALVRTAG